MLCAMSWVGPTFDPLSTRPTRPVLFLFVPVITTMSSTTTELRWARVEINIEETESNQILEDKNFPNKFFCSLEYTPGLARVVLTIIPRCFLLTLVVGTILQSPWLRFYSGSQNWSDILQQNCC